MSAINILGDMQKLVINQGDKLVLMCEKSLNAQQKERIALQLSSVFPDLATEDIIILDSGIKIGIIGAKDQ